MTAGSRLVLVTGATSGIGAAIAQAFATQGASVTATGATAAKLESARAKPGMHPVTLAQLDVRDAAAVNSLVQGRCDWDVVVNCAGVIRRGVEYDPVAFAEVLDINLTGTMRVCAAAHAVLSRQRGCIVNTASMLSFCGSGQVPGYSASKGGVARLTKSLAIAYAADGIRVNAVAPGWIATPLTQALQEDPARSGPILARTPMGHTRRCGRTGAPSGKPAGLLRYRRGTSSGRWLPLELTHRPSARASQPPSTLRRTLP